MPLLQEMEQQGLVLFKYRGILPVIIILTGLGVYLHTKISGNEVTFISEQYYEFICLGVALLGGFIRAYAVGYTPYNTSGRNIDAQIADTVNTNGIYSIVRHPLYVGNFFCSLGIAMLTQNLWFILFFIMLYWVYYERIMFAEEQFLTKKFGMHRLSEIKRAETRHRRDLDQTLAQIKISVAQTAALGAKDQRHLLIWVGDNFRRRQARI